MYFFPLGPKKNNLTHLAKFDLHGYLSWPRSSLLKKGMVAFNPGGQNPIKRYITINFKSFRYPKEFTDLAT